MSGSSPTATAIGGVFTTDNASAPAFTGGTLPAANAVVSLSSAAATAYTLAASGDAGESFLYTAASSTGSVAVAVDGTRLTVTPLRADGTIDTAFTGSATITVTAYDRSSVFGPAGRSAIRRFDVVFGKGAVDGTVYLDANGNGTIESGTDSIASGFTVRATEGSNTFTTVTDATGRYRFLGLDASKTYTLTVLPPVTAALVGANTSRSVSFGGTLVQSGADFILAQRAQLRGAVSGGQAAQSLIIDEGSTVTFTSIVTAGGVASLDLDGDGIFSAFAASQSFTYNPRLLAAGGVPAGVKARDDGRWVYTAAVANVLSGTTYTDQVPVAVRFVGPTFTVAPTDQTAVEGVAKLLPLGSFKGPALDGTSADGTKWSVTVDWWNKADRDSTFRREAGLERGVGDMTHTLTFPVPGTYTVAVTVIDNDGQTDARSFQVVVAAGTPTAVIAGPATATEGDTVAFSGSLTKPGFTSVPVSGFEWIVAKKTTPTGTVFGPAYAAGFGPTISFVPDAAGTYDVTFSAVDPNGTRSAVVTKSVTVANRDPVATIGGGPDGDATVEGSLVTYSANVTLGGAGDAVTTYAWKASRPGAADITFTGPTADFRFSPLRKGTYTVALTVTDSSGRTATAPVRTLTVANVTPAFIDTAIVGLPDLADPIAEGSTVVLAAPAADAGTGALVYAWTILRDGTAFAPPAGTVTTADSLVFTASDDGRYSVTVTVTDADGAAITRSGEFVVDNVAPTGDIVSYLAADSGKTDRDAFTQGDDITFAIVGATDAASEDRPSLAYSFDLDDDGVWEVENSRVPSYTATAVKIVGDRVIRWRATDKDGGETGGTRTFSVANANPTLDPLAAEIPSPPAALTVRSRAFSALAAPATVTVPKATTITGRFADPGTTTDFYYGTATFTNRGTGIGSTLPIIVLSGNRFAAPYAFPAAGTYDVLVKVYDGRGGVGTTSMVVRSLDWDVSLSSSRISENQLAGTVVGDLSASVSTAVPPVTFALVVGSGSDDNAMFQISGSRLVTRQSFDYESRQSYTIRVAATQGDTTLERIISVAVADVNEAPSFLAPATIQVPENQLIAFSGPLARDPDTLAPRPMAYTIIGGPDAALFTINPDNGTLRFAKAPDFEKPTDVGKNNVYDIVVQAGDGVFVTTKPLAVQVLNGNDAPILSAPGTFTVTEDVAGNLLWPANVTLVTDIDSPTVTVTLEVADGTIAASTAAGVTVGGSATARTFAGSPASLNAFFRTAGRVRYTTALDNTVTRSLTVRAWDGQADAAPAVATIRITPVNDAPTLATNTATIPGAGANTPVEITYATLQSLLNPRDVDSPTISLRIESITAGTKLEKWTGGRWVAVNVAASAPLAQRLVGQGDKLRWTPAANQTGSRPAFQVRAWDGSLASSVPAGINVSIAAAAAAVLSPTPRFAQLKR